MLAEVLMRAWDDVDRDHLAHRGGRLGAGLGGRLDRAHVALHQARHRRRARHVTQHLVEHAFLRGREYVLPEDVKSIGPDVLRHRIITSFEADAEETTGFLLVPYYGACIHVPPPPANQTVYVITETGKGTMVYMSPASWDHVRPHVARLLELETELARRIKAWLEARSRLRPKD